MFASRSDAAAVGEVRTSTSAESERPPRDGIGRPGVWLGLALDHRTLFDALQTEWLMPDEGLTARLLGVCSYDAQVKRETEHVVPVALRLEVDRLPTKAVVHALRGRRWVEVALHDVMPSDEAVLWRGPLPLFAVAQAFVATKEQRARLATLARQVSNLAIPQLEELSRDIPTRDTPTPEWPHLPPPRPAPRNYDAVRGSMAMAWWALPRVGPWLDFLVRCFDGRGGHVQLAHDALAAPWLSVLPWTEGAATDGAPLWRSAIRVFSEWQASARRGTAADVIHALVETASVLGARANEVNAWASDTQRLLRADAPFAVTAEDPDPVARAVQLVLARPHPEQFKRWAEDQPTLPPAVWWAGAILCGLLNGYKRMPLSFRGDLGVRQFVAMAREPEFSRIPLTWQREEKDIVLRHGTSTLTVKPEHSRGRWYAQDLTEPRAERAALELAQRLAWPCVHRERAFPAGTYRGNVGGMRVVEDALVVTETVWLRDVPPMAERVTIDHDHFRKCLVTVGGLVSPPPGDERKNDQLRRMNEPQPGRLSPTTPGNERRMEDQPRPARRSSEDARPSPMLLEPTGLLVVRQFVSPAEEDALLGQIDGMPWLSDLKRRVQHYGWKYDYRARRISREMRIGPLPEWAEHLAVRLQDAGLLPWRADQVIVNEYRGNQGITKHIDCKPCFEEAVAMISLGESWEMLFKRGDAEIVHLLERGSAAVMTGDARYKWTHEIPRRKTEPSGLVRGRRVSVTFRKVRLDESS